MSTATSKKKPANLSLDAALLGDAKNLKINLSRAAEAGLRQAVAQAKAAQWTEENGEAIESSNRWVETHGLPLERYRRF